MEQCSTRLARGQDVSMLAKRILAIMVENVLIGLQEIYVIVLALDMKGKSAREVPLDI